MSALARLRELEIFRKGPPPEPSKPTKAPFDGFVGTPPHPFQKNRGDEKHYRWRLSWLDGGRMEVCALPELTWQEVKDRYPGAEIEARSDDGEDHA